MGGELQRCHVDNEAIFNIALDQALVSFVDLLNRDHLDVRGNIMLPAKVQHLLRFGDAADKRAGETAPIDDEIKHLNIQWFARDTDLGQGAIALEQL